MKNPFAHILPILLLVAAVSVGAVRAQGAENEKGKPAAPGSSSFGVLQGKWVRPDGGYEVTIKGVDGAGKLDAGYANPSRLPFSRAVASRDGDAIKVFLELRAGGYNGSTYTLVYDPVKDVLRGVYYQAVARQKYDVYFVRSR